MSDNDRLTHAFEIINQADGAALNERSSTEVYAIGQCILQVGRAICIMLDTSTTPRKCSEEGN